MLFYVLIVRSLLGLFRRIFMYDRNLLRMIDLSLCCTVTASWCYSIVMTIETGIYWGITIMLIMLILLIELMAWWCSFTLNHPLCQRLSGAHLEIIIIMFHQCWPICRNHIHITGYHTHSILMYNHGDLGSMAVQQCPTACCPCNCSVAWKTCKLLNRRMFHPAVTRGHHPASWIQSGD